MNCYSWIPIMLLFSVAGCVSTHVVDSNNADRWVPEARREFQGEEVDIITTKRVEHTGILTELNSDSLKTHTEDGGPGLSEELAGIAYVGQPANALGPVLGFLGGAAVGGILGFALGAGSEEPTTETLGLNTFGAGVGGGAIGILVGGALGLVIGGVATSVDQYEIYHTGNRSAGATHEPEVKSSE